MAQHNEASKSADKGKGKATDKEVEENKKTTKDAQPNGKKDDEKIGCASPAPATSQLRRLSSRRPS